MKREEREERIARTLRNAKRSVPSRQETGIVVSRITDNAEFAGERKTLLIVYIVDSKSDRRTFKSACNVLNINWTCIQRGYFDTESGHYHSAYEVCGSDSALSALQNSPCVIQGEYALKTRIGTNAAGSANAQDTERAKRSARFSVRKEAQYTAHKKDLVNGMNSMLLRKRMEEGRMTCKDAQRVDDGKCFDPKHKRVKNPALTLSVVLPCPRTTDDIDAREWGFPREVVIAYLAYALWTRGGNEDYSI